MYIFFNKRVDEIRGYEGRLLAEKHDATWLVPFEGIV